MSKDRNKGEPPTHVAITLDGNRRFARKHGWKVWRGHEAGFDKIGELLEWCRDLGIKELTLYCFSTENFNRDKMEVKYLFDLFRNKIDGLIKDSRVHTNEVRIRIIGKLDMFPKDMQEKMQQLMDETKEYDKFCLNLAMAYGGRAEIVDAVKQVVSDVEAGKLDVDEIDEDMLSEHMYLQNDPDMVIRPGGVVRTSNFLTWSSVYSELIFIDKLWPEFTKQDLAGCIKEYSKRERRFGK